jgi:hypothetical protein
VVIKRDVKRHRSLLHDCLRQRDGNSAQSGSRLFSPCLDVNGLGCRGLRAGWDIADSHCGGDTDGVEERSVVEGMETQEQNRRGDNESQYPSIALKAHSNTGSEVRVQGVKVQSSATADATVAPR